MVMELNKESESELIPEERLGGRSSAQRKGKRQQVSNANSDMERYPLSRVVADY